MVENQTDRRGPSPFATRPLLQRQAAADAAMVAPPPGRAVDEEIGERIRALMERRKVLLQRIEDVEKSYDAVDIQLQDVEASL